MIFATHVMVDWSARSAPSPLRESADALWLCVAGRAPQYFRTRAELVAWLAAFVAEERAGGRRVLAGFDFPFGYPQGFAARLTGRAEALAVWDWLGARVTDGPDNRHNAFAVAEAINAEFGGGPFWGRPRGAAHPGVPERKADLAAVGLPDFRRVEAVAKGAKSCWQLAYAGSVGAQALTGIAALARLRRDPRLAGAAVWPFETGLAPPDAPLALVEIYPSLLAPAAHPVRDAGQVRAAAEAFAALDAAGGLAELFAAPGLEGAAARAPVAREEGWILGADRRDALRAAAAPAPRLRDDCLAPPDGGERVGVDVALARLREGLGPVVAEETVPLGAGGGRILARDLAAARAHPPCANAAVDGYGFAAATAGGAAGLPLAAGRAAAGAPFSGAVPPGHALRILTGAPLPAGVDTVVMQEDVVSDGAGIRFERAPRAGANTRSAGEDVVRGAAILRAGRRLAPQDLALAAAAGLGEVPVRARLRVGVLSTGDEIRAPGVAVAAHQVHDANRPMLLELLRRWDMAPVDLGQAPDDAAAVAAALDRGAAGCDAVLTSGGASGGDEDHVARLLAARGSLQTWRIAVKPGRPLAMGRWRGVPVFGLPGNPVAAFVCALVFARPALGALAGAGWSEPRGFTLPAAFAKSKRAGRREYLRARLTAGGAVEIFASEGSGRVSGLVWAEGLAELEDGAREIRPGDPVRYLPFAEFGL